MKELKVAVPKKPGFKAFVNATSHNASGYCIDIFEAAAKKLPHVLHYEFVAVDGSYDELVRNVSSGVSLAPFTCMPFLHFVRIT